MEGAPSITSSLPDEIEGSCGENLQLRCTADGQPNPEVNDFLNFECKTLNIGKGSLGSAWGGGWNS